MKTSKFSLILVVKQVLPSIPVLYMILDQFHPHPILTRCLFKIPFSIILPSPPRCAKCLLCRKFPCQNCVLLVCPDHCHLANFTSLTILYDLYSKIIQGKYYMDKKNGIVSWSHSGSSTVDQHKLWNGSGCGLLLLGGRCFCLVWCDISCACTMMLLSLSNHVIFSS